MSVTLSDYKVKKSGTTYKDTKLILGWNKIRDAWYQMGLGKRGQGFNPKLWFQGFIETCIQLNCTPEEIPVAIKKIVKSFREKFNNRKRYCDVRVIYNKYVNNGILPPVTWPGVREKKVKFR